MNPAIVECDGRYFKVVKEEEHLYWVKRLNKDMDSVDKRMKWLAPIPKDRCEVIGYSSN